MNLKERNREFCKSEDFSNKSLEKLMDVYHQNSKNIPIKPQIKKLEISISELKNDQGLSKKEGQILRSEIMAIDHRNKEKCNSIAKDLMDDLFKLQKELKNTIYNDKIVTDAIKYEIQMLNMEKIIINDKKISLSKRIKECEKEIGIDENY